jgi:hypothetical protein
MTTEVMDPPVHRMNPEVKAIWLEELPKHEQGKEHLENANGRKCCMGVLAFRLAQEGVVERRTTWVPNEDYPEVVEQLDDVEYGEIRESQYLPLEVCEYAGLTENNPIVKVYWSDLTEEQRENWRKRNSRGKKATFKTANGGVDAPDYILVTLAEMNDNYGMTFTQIGKIINREL